MKTGTENNCRNLGRNQMLWDSGLEASQMDNLTAVQNKIFEVEQTFDLVMMADRCLAELLKEIRGTDRFSFQI